MSESRFYDQGESHVFSDWLATSVLGVGVESLDEFYVGSLPDLSDFLNRETNQPQLDSDYFKKLLQDLQPFGRKFSKAIEGKILIDLGSGRPHLSVMPRLFAQVFGATKYIGVDLCHEKDFVLENEFPGFRDFRSEFVRADFIEYLSKMEFSSPSMISLFGVEVRDEVLESEQIRLDLAESLKNRAKSNDLVLLGAGTTDIYLSEKAFKKIVSDHYNFLFERKSGFLFF